MFTPAQLDAANAMCKGTLMETLGIRFVPGAGDTAAATMPVGPHNHQPMGLLHGGATAALAESLGSSSSYMLIDRSKHAVVGIHLSAEHLRSVREGVVRAEGKLVHQGRSTHVWDIRVMDEQDRLIAVCRLTNMIIDRKP